MYYVYVLKSDELGVWYTGSTNDLRKRLSQHNQKQSKWTKRGAPWKLIYYEASLDKTDANAREIYLKTGMGKRYIKNRLKSFLTLTG